jgi:tetratricopeptide (TPR) repeat protein
MTRRHTSKPSTPMSLLVQANDLRRRQEYRAAIGLYLTVISRYGETTDLLSEMGFCFFALSEFDQAVAWAERAVVLAPNDARAHTDLATYLSLGTLDLDRAAREYRRAIELDSQNVRALLGAAALYGVPEHVVTREEAIGWLERVVQLEVDNPNWHARLGQLYYEARMLAGAERAWRRALLCAAPLGLGYIEMIKRAFDIEQA